MKMNLHPRTLALKPTAIALLMSFAATACSDEGPTAPGPTSLEDLFGVQLISADGRPVEVQALDSKPAIGIYFADRSCSACSGFTPILVDAYTQLRDEGRPFEVVLVSLGISDSALSEYMLDSGMDWLAVPSQSGKAEELVQRYNVRWIPTLVVVDGEGGTLSSNGREEVTEKGAAAYDDWLSSGTPD